MLNSKSEFYFLPLAIEILIEIPFISHDYHFYRRPFYDLMSFKKNAFLRIQHNKKDEYFLTM